MTHFINGPFLKVIVKYRNYPRFLAIASEYASKANLSFIFNSKEVVLVEMETLDVSKALQENDIPFKTTKINNSFFAEAICYYFNKSLENDKFFNC